MFKLCRLARTPLTQHDLERSKIAQFFLLCSTLFYSALGHHEKVEGHGKKFYSSAVCRKLCPSSFKLLPAPLLKCKKILECKLHTNNE